MKMRFIPNKIPSEENKKPNTTTFNYNMSPYAYGKGSFDILPEIAHPDYWEYLGLYEPVDFGSLDCGIASMSQSSQHMFDSLYLSFSEFYRRNMIAIDDDGLPF